MVKPKTNNYWDCFRENSIKKSSNTRRIIHRNLKSVNKKTLFLICYLGIFSPFAQEGLIEGITLKSVLGEVS